MARMTRASLRASGLAIPTPLQPLLNALLRVWAGLVAQLAMRVCIRPWFSALACYTRDEATPDADPGRETQEQSVRKQTDNLSSMTQPSPRSSRRKSGTRGVMRRRSWPLDSDLRRNEREWGFSPQDRPHFGALSRPHSQRRRGSRLARQRESSRQKISALRALAGCPPARATRLRELEQSRQRALS
jgi:hypothetical protein